jgi:hypothetical protein
LAFFTLIFDAIDAMVSDRQTVTFAAGNFTGNGSMTWTLTSPDQVSFWYQIHNKLMTVGFQLDTTTVGGTPSTELRILIPNSRTCAVATFEKVGWANDNGTVREAYAAISGTTIAIRRTDGAAWTASTNLTYAYGRVTFPIS